MRRANAQKKRSHRTPIASSAALTSGMRLLSALRESNGTVDGWKSRNKLGGRHTWGFSTPQNDTVSKKIIEHIQDLALSKHLGLGQNTDEYLQLMRSMKEKERAKAGSASETGKQKKKPEP